MLVINTNCTKMHGEQNIKNGMTVLEWFFKEDGVWFDLQLSGSGQVLLASSRRSTQDSEMLPTAVTKTFLNLDVQFC